jgi:hypothetical protein
MFESYIYGKASDRWGQLGDADKAATLEQARYATFVNTGRYKWLVPVQILVVLPLSVLLFCILPYFLWNNILVMLPGTFLAPVIGLTINEWMRTLALKPEVLKLLEDDANPLNEDTTVGVYDHPRET